MVAVGEAEPGAAGVRRGGLDRVAPGQGCGQVGVGRHLGEELGQPGGLEQGVVGGGHEQGRAEHAQGHRHGGARAARLGRHGLERLAAARGLEPLQAIEQLGALDRDEDAVHRRRRGEGLDDPLDHGPAADLDQRLVADAGVFGQRIPAGTRAGEHQRGQRQSQGAMRFS